MQLLLTAAAYDRIKDRIAPFVGDLDIVTVDQPRSFQRNGRAISPEDVDPQIVWSTLEGFTSGLLPTLIGTLLKSPDVKWLQTFNAGLDNPVFKQIMSKGVRITKSSAQGVTIAEYVLGHALSLILPIDTQKALQSQGVWAPTPHKEVSQTRWVLVGYGAIGHEIALRIKSFGVHLTVVRRNLAPLDLADDVVQMTDLSEAITRADVVVLACALNPETQDMADAAFFSALKPGSILINIGRGGLVDEDALRVGLESNQPAHAVLDVFQTEPLPEGHWLWSHPKVRVSAHTSNSGLGTQDRADLQFIDNLRRYLGDQPLTNEASPDEVGLPAS